MGQYRIIEYLEEFTVEKWFESEWVSLDKNGNRAKISFTVEYLPKRYENLSTAQYFIEVFKKGRVIHEVDD